MKTFEVQPLVIAWVDVSGKKHRYTPDVLVSYQDHLNRPSCIFEVKYSKELVDNRLILLPKILAAIQYCRAHELLFKIVTERRIRTGECATAKFLLPFLRRIQNHPAEGLVLEVLATLRRTTPSGLLAYITHDSVEQAEMLPALWALMANRKIGCDLTQKIHMESDIWHILQ